MWRPKQAIYHERVDTATEVLGQRLTMPVLTAPCGGMRLVHPDGDIGLTRAAADFGICHIASAVSGFTLEEIAASHPGPKWFQLYRLGSRPLMESLVHRAQAAGFGALVVTIDSVVVGYREKDFRNGFSYDMRINLKNVAKMAPRVATRPRWLYQYWRDGMPFEISNTRPVEGGEALPISAMGRTDLSHSPTWEDIEWIRANWEGPMIVKGVMGAEDARRAVDAGADGIVVSNHGGRQLDGSPATIRVLPEIVAEVGGETTVLLDSGIRRANDVARAVAARRRCRADRSDVGLRTGAGRRRRRHPHAAAPAPGTGAHAPPARRRFDPRPRPELHRPPSVITTRAVLTRVRVRARIAYRRTRGARDLEVERVSRRVGGRGTGWPR